MGAFRQDDDEARLNAHLARRLRHAAVEMKAQAAASRLRLLGLEQRYDPNQPRVPAGNPDGGQWTSTGGGGASGRPGSRGNSSRRSAGDRAAARALADAFSSSAPTWRTVATDRLRGGRTRYTHLGNDGNRITEERWGNGTGRNERSQYRVASADGALFIFDNQGNEQRIYDAAGKLLFTTLPGPTGSVLLPALPVIQRVAERVTPYVARGGEKALQAARRLYGLLQNIGRGSDLEPVIGFKAREFHSHSVPPYEAHFVRTVEEREIARVCRKYRELRKLTKSFTDGLRPDYEGRPQALGTAVHWEIKQFVDKNWKGIAHAEKSIIKAEEVFGENARANYGEKNTLRIDVYEPLSTDTICVYDVKTGKSGLSDARIEEISEVMARRFNEHRRFFVIEVRP